MAATSKKHGKRSPASTAPASKLTHAPTDPTGKQATDKNLTAWLQEQARKLKDLTVKGKRLKLDFLANARKQGRILLEVRKRLANTPLRFQDWVANTTDIGYSTAQLWMDVAQNYAKVKGRFSDSNPLELTVRQVRDAIRDDRQEQGKGKPRSGKRKSSIIPKTSLLRALMERWALCKADPDFKPPQQSDVDFNKAHLCFQYAKLPDSTYATVAQATGKDEEEVKRLLRGLDIDTADAEWAEFRRHTEDQAQDQSLGGWEHKTVALGEVADGEPSGVEDVTPDDPTKIVGKGAPEPLPPAIHIITGCKRFRIETNNRLTCLDGHGYLITLVAENKDIAKQLKDALAIWEGGK
jgi:hypothetical protein